MGIRVNGAGGLEAESRNRREKNISKLENTPNLMLCSVTSRKQQSLSASSSSKDCLLWGRIFSHPATQWENRMYSKKKKKISKHHLYGSPRINIVVYLCTC